MPKSKSSSTTPGNVSLLTEGDGRALAVQMLREANDIGLNDLAIHEHERHGRPQNNLVLRYLDALRKADSRRADIGFCSVLSDFIGTCTDGSPAIDPDFYQQAFH